jgi:hypothetical protein
MTKRPKISYALAELESKGLTPTEAFLKAWNWTPPDNPSFSQCKALGTAHGVANQPGLVKLRPRVAMIELGISTVQRTRDRELFDFLKKAYNQEGYAICSPFSESIGGLYSPGGRCISFEVAIPGEITDEDAITFLAAKEHFIYDHWGKA